MGSSIGKHEGYAMALLGIKKSFVRFPQDFLWGAATADYQVSGGSVGNWADWEKSKPRLRQLIADGVNPKRLREFIAGDACEFNKRYPQDLSMARAFGHNAIRFSIDWARVETTQGVFDKAVLNNYRAMCDTARSMGLEPIVTLYHWTHPRWFEKAGGWTQDDAAEQFWRFVSTVLPYLGPIKYFTVLNEPNVYATFSYRWDMWPPQMASEGAYWASFRQLLQGYRLSHIEIKKVLPAAQVGIAMAINWNDSDDPAQKLHEDRFHTDWLDQLHNAGLLDFIGIQTYMHSYWCTKDPSKNKFGWEGHDRCTDHPVQSDMIGAKHEHWGMCPEAIYRTVTETYNRYRIPVMVTEHGHAIPEMVDHRRCWYLWESIGWLEKAIAEGVPLIGYLHWSLLDNFEWKYGWGPQFGLFHVDRTTQKRTPRFSAVMYRDIIYASGRTNEIAMRYSSVITRPPVARSA